MLALDDLQSIPVDRIAPTALALVDQIAVADGTPPTDEDQIAELLVLP